VDPDKKPYAFRLTIVFRTGERREITRVVKSEAGARQIGMLMPRVCGVEDVRPVTKAEYRREFGSRRRPV